MKRSISILGAHLLALTLVQTPTANAVYAFTSHSFTSCGITGATGPSLANCRGAYSTTWDESDSNFTVVNGIQFWTVPATGSYSIVAAGAVGGRGRTGVGGSGSVISGNFLLSEGTKLRILVGQSGTDSSSLNGGGGGASYVVKASENSVSGIYVIAGGGGGGGYSSNANNVNSLATNSGQPGYRADTGSLLNNPASSGSGGFNYDKSGGGGGGFTGDGGSTTYASCGLSGGNGGRAFTNGGSGASGNYAGGFGGGGSGDWCYWTGGGGGGGYSGGSGGYYYGSGGGGGSYNNGTNQLNTAGTNTSSGYVTITSLGPELVQFSSSTLITKATSLSYTVNFGQSVTGLAASDFSVSGTGSSGCTVEAPSGSGTNYILVVNGCSPGTVILTLATNSVVNTSAQSGPTSNNTAQAVLVDRTAPTISSVSAPSNSTYIPGNALNFTVNFSESVTVTGLPRLTLTVGSLTKYATFVSLTDSKTATFRYTVVTASGEFDTDGIAVSTTLDLNGGAIADLATNALSPLTFTAPTLTSVLVAQTPAAPTITSITPSSGTLSVAFTAGATNGSAISNYQYSTDNGANWSTRSPVATTSPISILGLTNGTAYNVRLRAVNGAGAGDSSTAVSATPSAVVVSGDATLTTTYGQAALTGTYSSTGGTGPYTYTLSSTPSGVSISGGVVTASASTPAGTYVRNVVSTDSAGTPQSGSKQLTITINKASTTITISLPGGASDAALGGAITITASVSQAGSVNFKLGSSSISGCSSVSSSAGTATCSWTPGALGGASLTAVLTPTDSNNYENATTSTLSITVVNGVTSLALSLAGGVTQAQKGRAIVITATVDQAGRISFFVDGKRIPRCFNKAVSTSSKTCTWKPSIQKQVTISSRLVPTNSAYSTATESMKVWVVRRTGTR